MSFIDEYNEREKRRKEKLVIEDLKRKLNPEYNEDDKRVKK